MGDGETKNMERELDATALDLLNELSNDLDAMQLQPGEITSTHFAEYKGITRKQATHVLNKLVESGELTKRQIIHDGRPRVAYRKATDD